MQSRGHDANSDINESPEKLYPSLERDDEFDQFNSSGNESFDKSKSSSRKLIRSEIYEERQTIRTDRTYNNYDERTPEGRQHHGRWPESASNTSFPAASAAKSDNANKSIYYWTVAIVIIAILLWLGSRHLSSTLQKRECPQFKVLAQQYAHQDQRLWKSLKINIENVLNQTPEQPSVFLLAYNDRETVERIMADIINVTAQCMRSTDPIQLNGGTFANAEMLKDYGVIIQTYRERLESQGIMYVADLHETPAEAAEAFHTICDIISPLVHKSVIFFTLYVEEATAAAASPKQIHKLVEDKLYHNWNTIKYDTLSALIGRVTDQVFFLHSGS